LAAPLRYPALLRTGQYRFTHSVLRSRASPDIHVQSLATVLLAHVPAYDRFDEIPYLVEKASDDLNLFLCR
jgi:hypothetical protein